MEPFVQCLCPTNQSRAPDEHGGSLYKPMYWPIATNLLCSSLVFCPFRSHLPLIKLSPPHHTTLATTNTSPIKHSTVEENFIKQKINNMKLDMWLPYIGYHSMTQDKQADPRLLSPCETYYCGMVTRTIPVKFSSIAIPPNTCLCAHSLA